MNQKKTENKRYKTIVVDPPWEYGKWGRGTEKATLEKKFKNQDYELPYESMSVGDIKWLPIHEVADEDCDVYLWTTQKYLPKAFDILECWGFEYKQILTWCKTPRGLGQGGLFVPTTEFILLGRQGKMPKKRRIDTTWWNWKRQKRHSQKPEEFQNIIETVSHEPRLEMFARRKRKGWDVWGNEVESDIQLDGKERHEA